ncbi:MAG: hypothetical protein QW228_01220 [Candidatus Aenigmatarchaeota archaeon]
MADAINAVRAFIMDFAEKNELLDDQLEFDDSAIANAINRVIEDFNLTPPLIIKVSLQDFPNNQVLLEATVGFLLRGKAQFFERNRLSYTDARGVSMHRFDKAPSYMQLAEAYIAAYSNWRDRYKITKNLEDSYI